MILDSFTIHTIVIQMQYSEAFILWDRAGQISSRIVKIWPGLTLVDGQPNQQTLQTKGVQVQTGLKQSTITLRGEKSLDAQRIRQIKETFELLRDLLELSELTRVSARASYVRKFKSLRDANSALIDLKIVNWPTERVFDQSMDGERNGIEVQLRFEDKTSFSVLRLKAEEIRLEMEMDADFFDEPIKESRYRMVIDFDRGVLGAIDAAKFRMDDWLKGYVHVLRRDINKVIQPKP
ncbi:hypothetical protein M0D69_04670 [Caballeronia sp. SEWSISQ10-4 2]|uniref:hypothetical protein n=1 Tax=Caballeronia sp. SEWSISQ10-4 2 TaxID=2937438 RepID=UPI00264DBDE8|nr:hypothetical protein [Caballeronia sp. SEWSISQ10-4 2]MDN7177317.1 hypothetical protein [Caballeronia sp. SEWSISQ10-4 2]